MPPPLLTVIFGIRPRTYLWFLVWLVGCPVAARFEVSHSVARTTSLSIVRTSARLLLISLCSLPAALQQACRHRPVMLHMREVQNYVDADPAK